MESFSKVNSVITFFITIIIINSYLLPLWLWHFEKITFDNSFSVLTLSHQRGKRELLVLNHVGMESVPRQGSPGHAACAGGGARAKSRLHQWFHSFRGKRLLGFSLDLGLIQTALGMWMKNPFLGVYVPQLLYLFFLKDSSRHVMNPCSGVGQILGSPPVLCTTDRDLNW